MYKNPFIDAEAQLDTEDADASSDEGSGGEFIDDALNEEIATRDQQDSLLVSSSQASAPDYLQGVISRWEGISGHETDEFQVSTIDFLYRFTSSSGLQSGCDINDVLREFMASIDNKYTVRFPMWCRPLSSLSLVDRLYAFHLDHLIHNFGEFAVR